MGKVIIPQGRSESSPGWGRNMGPNRPLCKPKKNRPDSEGQRKSHHVQLYHPQPPTFGIRSLPSVPTAGATWPELGISILSRLALFPYRELPAFVVEEAECRP